MPDLDGVWVEEQGRGSPLFLIPGLSGVARGFAAQMEGLSPHFRVISYDRRGSGRSAPATGGQSVEDMADEALVVMDRLGLTHADVLGHSTGGAVALSIAARFPERIDRMVISAGWARPDPVFRAAFDQRKRTLLEEGPEAYLRLATAMTFPADFAAAHAAALEGKIQEDLRDFPKIELVIERIDAICRFDVGALLGGVACPTLVLCAEDDRVVPAALSLWIAAAIPGAVTHCFPTGGHAAPRLTAGPFNQQVLDFLRLPDDEKPVASASMGRQHPLSGIASSSA